MTWKEVMSKALETQVAAPLVGVPLDGRYARYTGDNDVEIPIASLPAQSGDDSSGSGTQKRQGAVVNAVRDIFSLFGQQRKRSNVNVRTVTVETRQKARNERVQRRRARVQRRRARARRQQQQRFDSR